MSDWQNISTAPKDGFFIVYEDGAMRMMLRERGRWLSTAVALDEHGDPTRSVRVRETGVYNPTHWMPLPPPPREGEAA